MAKSLGENIKDILREPPLNKLDGGEQMYVAGQIGAIAQIHAKAQFPLPMILHCPLCRTQHIDAPEPENGWTNPPHKSHKCHGCGMVWRPADVETVGVLSIKTRGEKDTWPLRDTDNQQKLSE